jgi:glycosyltransferase involved in cell wall biosynthesis
MRILMLVPHSQVRGPIGRIVELLIPALGDLGCEVETVPWGRHTDDEGPVSKLVGRLADAFRVRRVLESRPRPDAIVVQTSHDWRSLARDLVLVRVLGRRAPPTVLQWHGSRADLVSGRGQRTLKRATLLLLRAVTGALVLSSEERASFGKLAPNARIEVVSNPFVPLTDPGKRDPARPAAAPARLLFVARLLPEKGVFDAVAALGLLLGRGRRAGLVIAGAGPAEPELKRTIAALRLESSVTLAGHLPQTSLAREYEEADVFVFPTYHPVEGFPTVIAEAMGAGLPIVTTRMRGITDHLRDGVNALFVPAQDPDAVAAATERLLADDELQGRMGDANREAVKAFAPGPVARAYLEALHRVVNG